MFTFLHCADIHLDSPLRGLEGYADAPVEQIRQATRRAFDNLVDLAIEERAAFLLIAGDLYDGDWKDYNTGLFFIDRMARLRKNKIRVLLASGNHDAASRITRELRLPDNVTLFSSRQPETRVLADLGVAVHGQSYPVQAVTENLAANYPPYRPGLFNIGLLHTSLTGREGHASYAPCSLDDLRSRGYDYWALGHVHRHEVVATDPWVVFPGNIQGRHIQESGSKGAVLVTVEQGRVAGVEQRLTEVLRWALCRVDLSGCEHLEAVADPVRAALESLQAGTGGLPLAVRLELCGRTPVHQALHGSAAHLIELFRGITADLDEVWLEKVLFHTSRPGPAALSLEDNAPISSLLRAIADLEPTPESMLELAPELGELKARLPAELLHEEGFALGNAGPDTAAILAQVRELLLAGLLGQGGEK